MSGREAILVVDDQPDFTRGMARLLAAPFPGLDILQAVSGEAALALARKHPVRALVTDLRMPGMSGLDLLNKALLHDPTLSVVLLTGHGDIETAVAALKSGAYDFLTKPVETERLVAVLSKALERSRLLTENIRLRSLVTSAAEAPGLAGMLGESPAMRRVKETLSAVAASDYTVLIRGESGTGKELAARAVHDLSRRARGPYLSVNCPAIPDQLLESELFGHVRGAFTGAERDRKGLFLTAGGGTLVLDEIGDISHGIQTKLLRVLQEREIRPVGSSRSQAVDTRVVASTNRNLEAHIRDGAFREDLFYRLNVLTVHLPPLRERREDIPLLTRAFLSRSLAEMGLPQKEMSPEALAHLCARDWPGNVRELLNFVRRLAVFGQNPDIDLSLVLFVENRSQAATARDEDLSPYLVAKARVVDGFTKAYVEELLRRTGGNVSEAARISGLERVSLQKILRRLSIEAAGFR
ncbi:sigma-54-dependent transcriptional regulator [Desulfolutivibrio sp.]|uniref:sigma-54-dependent transcriptional regulator n=1 Tax=Desulfolutivibrio sp. TaxID=2773296 RepID=UPI002F96C2B6